LAGLGVHVRDDDGSGAVHSHAVTYVVGQRVQKWAILGGEIHGLSGETAIAVRLLLPPPPTGAAPLAPHTPGASNAGTDKGVDAGLPATPPVAPPLGSFRRHCNVCKQPYALLHAFYHQVRRSVRYTILYCIGVALAALLLSARCPPLSPSPSPLLSIFSPPPLSPTHPPPPAPPAVPAVRGLQPLQAPADRGPPRLPMPRHRRPRTHRVGPLSNYLSISLSLIYRVRIG